MAIATAVKNTIFVIAFPPKSLSVGLGELRIVSQNKMIRISDIPLSRFAHQKGKLFSIADNAPVPKFFFAKRLLLTLACYVERSILCETLH